MAKDSPNQTAADYVTLALSPALIMGLVGSLVLFLLEVCYKADGPWKGRLQWVLTFYVVGIVLTGRIALTDDSAKAAMYGGVLAVLTYIGMQTFVEYPPGVRELSFFVNVFLIGVVWWSANRLVRDCTNIDEDTDMSGRGLLQASGIGDPTEVPTEDDEVIDAVVDDGRKPKELTWWERYRKFKDDRNKKRTLGVWVVYFSLAALPLFGLGQALIPLEAGESRRSAFWFLTLYVGCGLGLLLTTCYLGLRRYLRQRKLQMPASMTTMWVVSGGGLVVVLLLLAALLPRPYAEYSLADAFKQAGGKKRDASKFAQKGDAPGEGEGNPGEAGKDGKDGGKTGDKGEGKGDKDKGGSKGQGGKDGGGDKGKAEKSGGNEKGDKGGKQGKGQDKGGQDKDKKDEGNKGGEPKQGEQAKEQGKQGGQNAPQRALQSMQNLLQNVTPWLKWILFALLAVVVIAAVLRGGLGWLANFTDWAKRWLDAWRNFWATLFGAKEEQEATSSVQRDEEAREYHQPFSAFANPFDSGESGGMSPRELVRYTYRAVEAWAREQGEARKPSETAAEFLERLGTELPPLDRAMSALAKLHARAEYAKGEPPANTADVIGAVWRALEEAAMAARTSE